ncbi:MAG: PIN domain-containing protein [Clostridium sp.]
MKRISEDEFINDIFNIINEDKTEKPKNLIQEDNFENKIIENNRLFVVDTENTNNYSFINNFKVNENDNIVLFFSNNSKSITIQTFDEILKCGAKILTQNVNVGGKNALDFQLVAFITEKTIRGNFSEIHVISNDTGFNYAIDYINSCYEGNINLEIIQNINKNTSKGKKNNKTVKINKESEEKKAFEEVASEKEENSENNNLIFINNTEKELSQEDYDKNIVDEAIKNMVIDIDKKQLQFIHKSMKQCKTYKSFYNSITNSFRKDGDKIYKELIKYKKFNGEVI